MADAPPTSNARRSPGRLDRTRDPGILDAALQGVAELGYDRLSMDDIAARAGVGKAAIYRRWPSKPVVIADAIAHWRRRQGSVEPPDTGSLRGDIEALVAAVPEFDDAGLSTIKVIVGVATAAMHDPVLAAALDDLVLSPPRQMIRLLLDHAQARGEIPPGRDLSLIPDVALGLNVVRVITGRPIDRVFVRRVLEDVILPLAGAPGL
ncbi:TetR/AcrR family transcriptional regulator [Mycolicibacterium brisbanense]|uniref:TetR family transcriptional regulator n=1 Tax=Mycolicibacterium brisbanense TaxID=146020 RepID=A0A100W4I1_9MYCO|nr:TetR/AcrR family transcriptional regulator [Mycolicibacterium brisbanense]MCV7157365.1 TetR/AcrR family transcriptional regulator [Mycolicibacterium brisbanense]GAS91479.1 TetR family transcriptional regulator [Mycolicibacterium brisbanense]